MVLITKMYKYGFSVSAIEWFRSYLSNRKQQTKVNFAISDKTDVPHGLPQGSKLSNLLFILFINDMPLHVSDVKIFYPKYFAIESLEFSHPYASLQV